MKKKLTIFLILLYFTPSLYSQQDSIKLYTWVPSAIAGLNLSQVALSNWTQGGEDAMSWIFLINAGLRYDDLDWGFRNALKFAYGQTKTGSESFQTNDNEIYLESVLSKKIDWDIHPYLSNTVRTSVTTGYNYDSIPAFETVAFFDPGYITQSIGFSYEKQKNFNFRLGVAVQEVITSNNTRYSDDPETPEIETFKLETGIESVTNAEFELAENVGVKTLLRLFSRFESMDVWDVRWDNIFTGKVNDYLNVNLTFLLVYEKSQSLKNTDKRKSSARNFIYSALNITRQFHYVSGIFKKTKS